MTIFLTIIVTACAAICFRAGREWERGSRASREAADWNRLLVEQRKRRIRL